MRTVWICAVIIGLSLLAPTPTRASHSMSPPLLFEDLFSSVSSGSRKVEWRPCNVSPSEQVTAQFGGYGNWEIKFDHSIDAVKLGVSCGTPEDLRVWGKSSEAAASACGVPDVAPADGHPDFLIAGCFATSAGNGQYYTAGSTRVVQWATHYFDYPYIDSLIADNGMGTYDEANHFAHEFGHGMGLADHNQACGYGPFVMVQSPCDELVNNGTYPNDVCTPDTLFGYSPARC